MPKIFPGASVYTPPSSVNVLSFHGGGYRGYFSALVAQALERRKASLGDRRPLAQSFDLLCGTSAGSIIAAGLAANVPISAIVTMMREKGPDIFPERRFLKTKPGFFGSRFASNNLKNALIATLGDIRLGALEKALLIPTVNETDGQPVVFRSYDPSQSDIRLVDVVLASAAAPTYFPLHRIGGKRYADGGLIANGPELIAASDLLARFDVPLSGQKILSIGTTCRSMQSAAPSSSRDRWGIIEWFFRYNRLLSLLMDGQVSLQRELLRTLGPTTPPLHLDIELTSDQYRHVDLVLANSQARQTLETASTACLKRISNSERCQIDVMLARVARSIGYYQEPGSYLKRSRFLS